MQKGRAGGKEGKKVRGRGGRARRNRAPRASEGRAFQAASEARKLTVAVDVDEVLGRFLAALAQFVSEAEGIETDITDYHVYRFSKVWSVSEERSAEIVHAFFKSRYFLQGIEPLPGAHTALQNMRSFANLVVVTSRQHAIQQHTLAWLDANFPGAFDDVLFGNHFALSGAAPRGKPELCLEADADVLVDDSPEYAVECANEGLEAVLFDWQWAYPWSKRSGGLPHPRVHRAPTWDAVEQQVKEISFRKAGIQPSGSHTRRSPYEPITGSRAL
jgi:5'(3')-deoxyribonucleotidase